MLPAELYTPLYHHVMLLVVIGCVVLYWAGQRQAKALAQFNLVAMAVIGVGLPLFMGFRPVSAVFVDMVTYAWSYQRVQNGLENNFNDRLFGGLMQLCSPVLPVEGFFFVCALVYIAPLAVACWRIHGKWAFPVFLAFITSFSFWAYGVNGIRNGMACSVLILAFAFYDMPFVMFPLMAAAWGFHGSTILPAGAFLIVHYIKRTEIWLAFWVLCVAATLVAGNVGEMMMSHFNPFTSDDRVERYIVNAGDAGGFRADFIAYSIVPVLVTLLLAAPTRARLRRIAARVIPEPALNWMREQDVVGANGVGMGMLAWPRQSGAGRAFSAGVTPAGLAGVSHVVCSGTETLPEPAAGTARPQCNTGGSHRTGLAGARETSRGQERSLPRAGLKQSGWNGLPWVQLLRSDPFYARLVNTYLLSNAIWLLVIHAEFSNRFAYLSWFMMPWVLLYPFVPGKINDRPRFGMIAATLCAQYSFTYLMEVVVYPLRGIQ